MNQAGTIRTLIVDDEKLARHRLSRMLSLLDDILIVGEAQDGDEALQMITEIRPDLVFLDIQMPGQSGLEVAASLGAPRPGIIFCTAYDEYAVNAFEQHALDYLLKPVSRERLIQALDRTRERLLHTEGLRELRGAQATQARLFPRATSDLRTLKYAGICRPARGVGGDYYDFLGISDGLLGIAMGDVSGKGMAAALLMAALQAQLQSRAPRHGLELQALLSELNNAMCDSTGPEKYATFFYAVYDEAACQLTYCNAGHNPPLHFRRKSTGELALKGRLEAGGTVLGMFRDCRFQQGQVQFHEGDLLVVYTDGVTETANLKGQEFAEEGLINAVRARAGLEPADLCQSLIDEVDRHGPGAPQDDLTLIVAKACPEVEN